MIYNLELYKNLKPKPKLLLHVCCAPCLLGVIELVEEYFDVTLYYSNDNIDTIEEYEKRYKEIEKVSKVFSLKLIKDEYDNQTFTSLVKGLENEPEKGSRCSVCYEMRLLKTKEKAEDFDFFMTTLTLSPYKNTKKINEIGKSISDKYIETDFKKNNGVLKSNLNTNKYNIYRQNFCGCIYSKR